MTMRRPWDQRCAEGRGRALPIEDGCPVRGSFNGRLRPALEIVGISVGSRILCDAVGGRDGGD
jgi:hypothetical protein